MPRRNRRGGQIGFRGIKRDDAGEGIVLDNVLDV